MTREAELLLYRIKMRLKNIKAVRRLVKPWIDRKLERGYQRYLRSEASKEIESIKGICKGQRCFIIGNGPSLTVEDLEQLKGEYTFAANRIYEVFASTDWRPWAYVAMDKPFVSAHVDEIRRIPCRWKFLLYEAEVDTSAWERTLRIHGGIREFPLDRGNDRTAFFQEDLTEGLSNGYTVTFAAIQLAVYMGFAEIYLLGVDFSYSVYLDQNGNLRTRSARDHFYKSESGIPIQSLEPTRHAYQVAREYCDGHGIRIVNATRGGKLEVFERMDFDEVVKERSIREGLA